LVAARLEAQIEVDNLQEELEDAQHYANAYQEDLRTMDLMVKDIRYGDPVSPLTWHRHLTRVVRLMNDEDCVRPIVVLVNTGSRTQGL
jgi:hypothetical protein